MRRKVRLKGKSIVLLCLLLGGLSNMQTLKAQEVKGTNVPDTSRVDSFVQKRPGFFSRIIHHFFNGYDTTYINPNRYNYALMVAQYANLEYYSLGSSNPSTQRIFFKPNPHYKIGMYFGWQWIFLGGSIDVDQLFKRSGKDRRTEFDLNLYSSKIGIDLYYRRTGNDYKIYKTNGFKNVPENYSTKFDGLKAVLKGLNIYYIFNSKHFSYPAAFSQSTNQRKSAGTWMLGLSYAAHDVDFDYTQLPDTILKELNNEAKIYNVEYQDLNINVGYAYNWVFAHNWLASISLSPAISYKYSKIEDEEERKDLSNRIRLDFILRSAIVWNNNKYYIGSSFVARTFDYNRKDLSLRNGFATLQIYAGFNFGLKKEYRCNKK